jgi:Spy/CpxP family protein refolding chaperone
MTLLAIVIAVLGIAAMRRAHHRCHGYHGYGWSGPSGHGWHGHQGWYSRHHARTRMILHAMFMRIDATPAQERAIVAEIERLQDRLRGAKSRVHEGRGDLAAALRGAVLDDAALGAALGRVDVATGEARVAMVDALRGVHGVLDDRQRAQLADMLDHGGGWWRGFGPYR